MLHDNQRISVADRFFICGGNPDGSGGGVIGTRQTRADAEVLQREAINQGYRRVQIMTWREMMGSD